ncbi:MAG: hypothetical protein WC867_08375 [Candidatus Pacearchaeota archaeon]|jgi:hypothetical protein
MKKRIKNKIISILIISILFIVIGINLISARPNGASITGSRNTTFQTTGSATISAVAGNLTEINIYGVSISQSWQGYMGNVTGGFQLSDSDGNIFYNWSSVSINGEVYSSRNETINWNNIQCFNFTAAGTYADDSSNKGNTSLYGMNVTQLETQYNIGFDDVDGVNETFHLNDHPLFFTNSYRFDSGECPNTRILNSTGDGIFEEVLLYSPDNQDVVFTSLLHDNAIGFDGREYDFEMMVLEDGHGADVSTTPYYFYVELGV